MREKLFSLSVFLERRIWSSRLVAPKSGQTGLHELVYEAYVHYQDEVINQSKLYQRFAEDFVYSHEFIDAYDAWSKNEHQKNFQFIKSLLFNRRDLVEVFFVKESFSEQNLEDLIYQFNTSTSKRNMFLPAENRQTNDKQSFCCCLEEESLTLIAQACNEAKIFTEVIDEKLLHNLLNVTISNPLHSKNNRMVAFFFDQLSISNLIIRNWQIVLAKRKLILSSSGIGFLNQKALSSALYQISGWEMSSNEKIIATAISETAKKNKKERISE